MRQYQALFEEYGVVAVFSGHSEMFERSFVDEDGDGNGVYYYDVGVAGDGMRGERTDEDGNLLSYNQFSQWTADQDEPELWQEVDGVPQNVAGGKHYGHLEVNLENLGEDEGTRLTFTPVYSFPLLDANYDLIDTERRVYGDEIVIELEPEPEPEILFQPVFGTLNNDILEIESSNSLVFTGEGSDLVDASFVDGSNRIYGDGGDDTIILGTGDRIVGAEGADRFFATSGGDNTITGGADADQFWIANAELPASANVITDFNSGEDVIGFAGLGIDFKDLSITQDGDDALISNDSQDLAILTGVDSSSLTDQNFAFA